MTQISPLLTTSRSPTTKTRSFNRLMDYQQDLSEQWFRALQELQDYRLAHPMDESLGMITPSPPWLN